MDLGACFFLVVVSVCSFVTLPQTFTNTRPLGQACGAVVAHFYSTLLIMHAKHGVWEENCCGLYGHGLVFGRKIVVVSRGRGFGEEKCGGSYR